MTELSIVAPAFVEMAHRIVWSTVATVDADGRPRSRVLHPIWEWDGESLTGWIATSPQSPKAIDIAHHPVISLTYWDATQDTCTADCDVIWDDSDTARSAGWERFASAPAPVGYDPRLIPSWTSPQAESFGILRLSPTWLRVFPGSLLVAGVGELLVWRA